MASFYKFIRPLIRKPGFLKGLSFCKSLAPEGSRCLCRKARPASESRLASLLKQQAIF